MVKFLRICIVTLYGLFLFNALIAAQKNGTPKDVEPVNINNIDILVDLATKVYYKTPERSLQYAETALDIARKNHDQTSEAKALKVIGDIYCKLDYDRLSLPFYSKALEILTRKGLTQNMGELYIRIGDVYYLLNKNDSARSFYQKGFNLYQSIKNKPGLATSYLKLGNTFWYSTNYDKALAYYLNSLSLFEHLNNKKGIAKVYNNIGTLYTVLDDYPKALQYLEKSLQYYSDFDDSENLSELYFRLGSVHQKVKNYDLAINYLDLAKSLFDSLHIVRKSAYVSKLQAQIYFANGKSEKAIQMALSALATFAKYQFEWGMAETSNDLGEYYLGIQDFEKSQHYFKDALKYSKDLKSWELLKTSYLNLSNYNFQRGDYKNAYDNFKQFQVFNDSVLNLEKSARIAELQAKYETNKKEMELLEKTDQINKSNELIRKQKVHIYLFGSGIVIILLMSFALFRQYKLIENKGRKIEIINEKLDLRVKERTSALRLTQFSIEQAADPIFWIDAQGKFIYVNNSACNTLGYSKNELFEKKIYDIIPKFDFSDWCDFWDINKQDGSLSVETTFKKYNASEFPVEIILNYIFHEDREYAFAFVRDISDRKQKEENLRNAKEKAEEADKLKSAFLANMSHEIRTPMNAIIGFSDMLLNEDFEQEEKQEFANIIKSSGDTLLKLIDDIIDISLIEAGQLKLHKGEFNLATLLKEIHRFFIEEKNRLNKTNLEIRLLPSKMDEKIFIPVDKIRFRQVLTNLIGNALKFTDSGYIEIGYVSGDAGILSLYVKDTGIGIPSDKVKHVFERFNKLNDAKRLYSGTGLGLTISKKIVEQMGGNLEVESNLGEGSRFFFTVPFFLNQQSDDHREPSPDSTSVIDWKTKNILIVEDVESNYQYLEVLLKKTGIQIKWAKDGDEAMKFCEMVNPDVILMDIQLPNKSGYEITADILLQYPSIPIIAQTAYAFSDEKEKILKAGCVEYLTKPLNSELLISTIKKYIS